MFRREPGAPLPHPGALCVYRHLPHFALLPWVSRDEPPGGRQGVTHGACVFEGTAHRHSSSYCDGFLESGWFKRRTFHPTVLEPGAPVRVPADRVPVDRWPFPCRVDSSYRKLIPSPPEGPAPHAVTRGLSCQQTGLRGEDTRSIELTHNPPRATFYQEGPKERWLFWWNKNLLEVLFYLVWFVQWTFLVSLLGL